MKIIIAIILIAISLNAQERVLLHIGRDGKQEVIPIAKNQSTQDVIARIENANASMIEPSKTTGLVDILRNYPNSDLDLVLNSNFGFTPQDIALQWFVPYAGGKVKEFWWRNYSQQGEIKKGTIRAWLVDPKLATRPANVQTKHLGYYKDPLDGDGLVTPYKPTTGDQWFYGNGAADSVAWRFDPLGTEVSNWLPGGLQVLLDSGKWQGVALESSGGSMFVNQGQIFGFTISNDTKTTDIIPEPTPSQRMEILSWPNTNPAPFHSLKWYETGRTGAIDKGWHLRGDYEWGMYVVIEYTTDHAPKIILPDLVQTTVKTSPRPITVTVTDDNPGGGPAGIGSVYFRTKNGAMTSYDSVLIAGKGSSYTGIVPAASSGDTIYWQFIATDVNGNRTVFGPRTYIIFNVKTKDKLLVYNSQSFSYGGPGPSPDFMYTGSNSTFNRWHAVNDGTTELADVIALYNDVMLIDGVFPQRNVYSAFKSWLASGTVQSKKNFFFSSQDYGCYITNMCTDTTFTPGTFEYDFLGLEILGPQDIGPSNRPFQIVPQPDPTTNFLIKYNMDSSTTLWYYPLFELYSTFLSHPDGMTATAETKLLFKDGGGANTLGVIKNGATFNSMFVSFDIAGLQFRSDTSLHNAANTSITDPKYRWIVDVGSIAAEFFKNYSDVEQKRSSIVNDFSFSQNYPNPFNPTTKISYQIPMNSHVTLKVFDILGREVATVVNEQKDAGKYTATFNAQSLSSGMYFYEMRAGSFVSVKKMLLMK